MERSQIRKILIKYKEHPEMFSKVRLAELLKETLSIIDEREVTIRDLLKPTVTYNPCTNVRCKSYSELASRTRCIACRTNKTLQRCKRAKRLHD